QWSAAFSANQLLNSSLSFPVSTISGNFGWLTDFHLTRTDAFNTTTNLQFQISVTGQGFNSAALINITCDGDKCSSPQTSVFQKNATDFAFSIFLPGDVGSSVTLNEQVTVTTTESPLDGTAENAFNFIDPMTLTFFDASGNIVPNLVLYNTDLNAII